MEVEVMNKKTKRIISLIMVMVMVFAMTATSCGKKEDAAEKAETKKEDTAEVDESDKEAADDQEEAKAEDQPAEESKNSDDVNEYKITDAQLQDLYDTVAATLNDEYIKPNNIQNFQWPTDDEFWVSCEQILTEYNSFSMLQSWDFDNLDMELSDYEIEMYKEMKENEPTVENLPASDEKKAIISPIYNAYKQWAEKNEIDFHNVAIEDFPFRDKLPENVKFDE